MTPPTRTRTDLAVDVDPREVARYLGYRGAEPPPRVARTIDDALDEARPLVRPAAAWRTMRRHDLAHSPYLYHVESLVLGLVTIGPALEAAVETHRAAGDICRALVLDAVGSAAAEAAADAAERTIVAELAADGLHASPRFSPGYACWDVKEQAWIVPALDGAAIGVTLTDHHMMRPRKSVSFAVVFGESAARSRHEHSCSVCGLVDCRFQRPPAR